jgi:hypothetical protein
MATAAQIQANRHNSQLSTGPRTESGKLNSSRNSYRHGLFTSVEALPEHERARFNAQLEYHTARYSALFAPPADEAEFALLADVALVDYRLDKVRFLETGFWSERLLAFCLQHKLDPDNLPLEQQAMLESSILRQDAEGPRVLDRLRKWEAALLRQARTLAARLLALGQEFHPEEPPPSEDGLAGPPNPSAPEKLPQEKTNPISTVPSTNGPPR